jgi:hypothetical protein
MAKLVDVSVVRDRIGYPNDADINTAITDALEGVTIKLESLLRTKFSTISTTDTYFIRPGQSRWSKTQFRTKLFLTRGFLSSATLTDVKYGASLQAFNSEVNRIDVDTSLYLIEDKERGVIDILDFDLGDLYVQVTYDSGFNLTEGDATLFDQTEVPDWLKEAAELLAIVELEANPAINPEDRSAQEIDNTKNLFTRVITPHIRYVPAAIRPITTEGGLYALGAAPATLVWESGEALSGANTVWTSDYVPVGTPIVEWGNLVWTKVDVFTANPNEYTITGGNTWTFDADLGATAPIVWYQRAL